MIYRGHIVDVVRHEIFDGEVTVKDGRISSVRPCSLQEDGGKPLPYLMPGFIDSLLPPSHQSSGSPCSGCHCIICLKDCTTGWCAAH